LSGRSITLTGADNNSPFGASKNTSAPNRSSPRLTVKVSG